MNQFDLGMDYSNFCILKKSRFIDIKQLFLHEKRYKEFAYGVKLHIIS